MPPVSWNEKTSQVPSVPPDGRPRTQCPKCSKFVLNADYNNHQKRVHEKPVKDTSQPPDSRPRKQCPDCSKWILEKQFKSHCQRVHGAKDHACDFPGCDMTFTVHSLLNFHKRIHGEPTFACQALECDYGSSHTFNGLLLHVERMHKTIYARYVKGRDIPWELDSFEVSHTPVIKKFKQNLEPLPAVRPRLPLTVRSANIMSSLPPPAKRHKLSYDLDQSEDDGALLPDKDDLHNVSHGSDLSESDNAPNELESAEERKFAVEELLQTGFTPDLKRHIQEFNTWTQQIHQGVLIHSPKPTKRTIEKYIVDGARMCSGSVKDSTCPYNVQIALNTAPLKLKSHAGGKVLALASRCFLCTKLANLNDFRTRLLKEKDGVLLCSQTAKCQNSRLPGRLQCQECADAWTATRIQREMTQRTLATKPKFGLGSSVRDQATMLECLSQVWIGPSVGTQWIRFFQQVSESPENVFVVDTETGFDGSVHEVGAVTMGGTVVVDDAVDYEMSLDAFYQSSQNGLSESQQFRAFCAVQKTYGPPNALKMRGITARDVLEKFKAAGMSQSSIWVEHSFGNFDYKKLKRMAPIELQHILPVEANVFSTLTLWRMLLPGLFSHKQSHLYSLLSPDQISVLGKRHSALPDALMCREVLKVAIMRFNVSAKYPTATVIRE